MSPKLSINDHSNNTSAYYMKRLLELFTSRTGTYSGKGMKDNHSEFSAQVDLYSIVNNDGISIKYKALDNYGDLFGEEHTVISLNTENKLTLWTLNSNFHTMHIFKFKNYKRIPHIKDILIFGFDTPEPQNDHREEITFELWDNGNLSYHYFWGWPNGEFLTCTNLTLSKL